MYEKDSISSEEKAEQLKGYLFNLTHDVNFKKSNNMRNILQSDLGFIIRNYRMENPYIIE